MSAYDKAVAAVTNIPDPALRYQCLDSLNDGGNFVNGVKAFHALYGAPDESQFGTTVNVTHMSDERLGLRCELIREEFQELSDAVATRDEIEMADALGDLIYVVTGFALEMGIDLAAVFSEIQASNMTKLGADGQPIRNGETCELNPKYPVGKILKGPNYVKPDIKSVLKYRD